MIRAMGTAALLTAALLAAPAANATGLSVNESPLAEGTTVEQCKAAGRAALDGAGLTALPDSPVSVYGAGANDVLAAIYCLPARGIAVVAIAGPDNALTRPLLNDLLQRLSQRH